MRLDIYELEDRVQGNIIDINNWIRLTKMVKRKNKEIESDKNIPEKNEYKTKRKKIRKTKDLDRTIALSKKKQDAKKYRKK